MNQSEIKSGQADCCKPVSVVLSWSGGKDSAYTLHTLMNSRRYDVKYLLSTFSAAYKRLSMHGVRERLIEKQVENIGLPLIKVYIDENGSANYEKQMATALLQLKNRGIYTIAYGDIFLEDLRTYREEKNALLGIDSIFPLWKMNTKKLLADFLHIGFKTITCCVSDAHLTENFCGKVMDTDFVTALPETVDPCGENGEYHSFCYDGPIFKKRIGYTKGSIIYRTIDAVNDEDITAKGFWYCDLLENS